jgi:hypothetical protein
MSKIVKTKSTPVSVKSTRTPVTTRTPTETKVTKSTRKVVVELTPGQKAAATKALTGIQFIAGKKAAETRRANIALAQAEAAKAARKAKVANRKTK